MKGGWHVNDEAPISVALTTPAGVTVKKAKLTRADLAASSKESARFDSPRLGHRSRQEDDRRRGALQFLCQEQASQAGEGQDCVTLAIEVTPARRRQEEEELVR